MYMVVALNTHVVSDIDADRHVEIMCAPLYVCTRVCVYIYYNIQ